MAFATRRALLLGAACGLLLAPDPAQAQRDRPILRQRAAAWRSRLAAERLRDPDAFPDWLERLERRRRRARALLARDGRGARFVRNIVLAAAPSEGSLRIAEGLGFRVGRRLLLPRLGLELVVLRPPPGMEAAVGIERLRAEDPEGSYALNHLYNPSAAAVQGETGAPVIGPPAPGVRIGMIDAGLAARHPIFKSVRIVARTFAGAPEPEGSPHGEAVASVLAAALPQAEILAADVFGDDLLAGSAEAMLRALAWLLGEGVGVINISLSGPANAVLDLVLRRAAERGVLIIAPCGNDGPAQPVGFPASHPDVVAVTAVDARKRVYLAANRGPEIMFAALGVEAPVAGGGEGWTKASGTSFAAPVIAARAARLLPAPDREGRAQVLRILVAQAQDLGADGRDPVYGYGWLESGEGPLLVGG